MITGTTPFREISFSLRVNFSPFGPKAGLSVQVIVMAMTKAIIITIPGMIPAINRLPTEFSVSMAYIMKAMDGGMRMASGAPAATMPSPTSRHS